MTSATETTPANGTGAVRNVGLLAFMQATLGAQLPVYIILGGLAGSLLAEDKSLATLPIACQMIAGMVMAAPASFLMGRFGRKPGFMAGSVCGIIAGGLGAWAILQGSFVLLCVAHAFAGLYQTTQNYFRFAATDAASDAFKPRAVSYVLAGGLISALIGPELVVRFGDLFAPVPFAGAYLVTIATSLIGMLAIPLLSLPKPPRRKSGESGRPMREIMRNPAVPVAMLCGMMSYGVMTFVMTSSPLAIVACGFGSDDAANVVRFHVLAMFAPSFFTGSLIGRFGHARIVGAGLALLAACAAIAFDRCRDREILHRAGAARPRLEFRLHRLNQLARREPPARRARQGAGPQRLSRDEHGRHRRAEFRQDHGHRRMGRGEPVGHGAARHRGAGAGMAVFRSAAAGGHRLSL